MKARIFLFSFFIFFNFVYSQENLKTGYYQTLFLNNYLEAQKRQKNIQRFLNSGIFIESQPQEKNNNEFYFIYSIHNLHLFFFLWQEDSEIIKTKKNETQYYIYSYKNSFLGFQYTNFYFTLGFSEPRNFLFKEENNLFTYEKYSHIFPSLDLRFEYSNHIFVISPLYLKEYEQKFIYDDEYLNYFVLFYYKNYNFNKNNHEFKNYKLHYTFLLNKFIFNINYYTFERQNIYSNKRNYINLNFSELLLGGELSKTYFSLLIQKSEGETFKGKKYYNINGYLYKFLFSIKLETFQFLGFYQKPTKSKWNSYSKDFDSFGFTSLFENPLPLMQTSSTFSISPLMTICNDEENCEGVKIEESKNYFINIAHFYFLNFSYFFNIFKLSLSAGLLEKKQNLKEINPIQTPSIYEVINRTNSDKTSIGEIIYSFLAKISNAQLQISYSNLYKKDYQFKKYKFQSHALMINFIYFF